MTTRTRTFALVAAIFLVVAIFAIPNLLSTTFVKQRVADQLSQLTGRQVALEGDSSISLRPYLGVSYDNVTISDAADAEGKPLIAIDELKAKLGLFAALFGDAELTELEFIRPHFHLRIDQNGHRNWLPEHGQMGAHIADPELGDRLRLGRLRIEDGILYPAQQLKLFMITNNAAIAHSDCLFYAVSEDGAALSHDLPLP